MLSFPNKNLCLLNRHIMFYSLCGLKSASIKLSALKKHNHNVQQSFLVYIRFPNEVWLKIVFSVYHMLLGLCWVLYHGTLLFLWMHCISFKYWVSVYVSYRYHSSWWIWLIICYTPSHGPLARYVNLRVAHALGMPGTFSPPPRVKWSRHASRHVRHAHAVMHAGIAN